MGYISLIKADGAVDLIPADNIVYVVGTEGAAESGPGLGNGDAPFVQIVQGVRTQDGELLANKVIIGPATGVAATTTAKSVMQNAVNDAIIKAAQAEGLVVPVDFGAILNVENYTGTTSDVTSAAPVEYAI